MTAAFAVAGAALLLLVPGALANVGTDQGDYSPGSVVTISGDGFQANETVGFDVTAPYGEENGTAAADDSGSVSWQFTLPADDSAVGSYSYTATGQSSGITQSGSFTDANAPGSLDCALSTHNKTHYNLQVGQTVTCTIDGATDVIGETTVPVIIKSSTLGNETVSGSVSGDTITFTYTGRSNGCNTTNVAYYVVGNTANNDVIVDGVKNGRGTSAAGFAFVDASGSLIGCGGGGGGGGAKDLVVTKDANPSYTRTYAWRIAKAVDKTEVDSADGSGAFTYTVTVTPDGGTDSNIVASGTISVDNPNSTPVSGVNVADAVDDGGSCAVVGGSGLTVPANGSVDVAYTCTYGSLPAAGTNTATATWPASFGSPNDSANGTAAVNFSTVSPTLVDNCVSVSDPLDSGAPRQFCVGYAGGPPYSFTYSHAFSGNPAGTCTSHDNTAAFTTNTSGTTGSDSKTVKVCVGADLQVSKTANPSFTRTYLWRISKAVDKTLVRQNGGTATFNYTVNVNQTGVQDSNWQVKGTVTATNPNDWEAISFDIADAVDNGGSCSFDGGVTHLTVAAGGTVNAPYTCTYASAPTPSSGTNTATASWDGAAAATPDASAQGTAGFAFTTPTTSINKTITVTDSFKGTLGTLTGTDSSPFASATYHYSRTVAVQNNTCVDYPNTATIVETGQSDSKTVKVCGGVTGGLTMGFWQNKNGQGIITGGAATAGVCNSATYLRTYAPFQDLSATASCAQVGTYVTNVIKAANASGAAMNAMLKGQMLATALDVYFSTPGLGGNKINAPTPLGAVKVDLTAVCKMIDGSGGTATCSGTLQNTGAAFGGATCLTINQLLAYAAGQSGSGGSPWYAQVKATQELAKNTFDAINNAVAFAC